MGWICLFHPSSCQECGDGDHGCDAHGMDTPHFIPAFFEDMGMQMESSWDGHISSIPALHETPVLEMTPHGMDRALSPQPFLRMEWRLGIRHGVLEVWPLG